LIARAGGAVIAATPGGVLGGITLVLYGMIGLLGARIWIDNRVNFADPVHLVPLAAGITAGIGNLTIKITSTFSIAGIATGTLMVIIAYHAVRPFARRTPQPDGAADEGGAMTVTSDSETPAALFNPRSSRVPLLYLDYIKLRIGWSLARLPLRS
jgi:hypothetical protein